MATVTALVVAAVPTWSTQALKAIVVAVAGPVATQVLLLAR